MKRMKNKPATTSKSPLENGFLKILQTGWPTKWLLGDTLQTPSRHFVDTLQTFCGHLADYLDTLQTLCLKTLCTHFVQTHFGNALQTLCRHFVDTSQTPSRHFVDTLKKLCTHFIDTLQRLSQTLCRHFVVDSLQALCRLFAGTSQTHHKHFRRHLADTVHLAETLWALCRRLGEDFVETFVNTLYTLLQTFL